MIHSDCLAGKTADLETAHLIASTEDILNGKLHFLCSEKKKD